MGWLGAPGSTGGSDWVWSLNEARCDSQKRKLVEMPEKSQHDLSRLRNAMHRKEGSCVSVMVGAGFSLNAEPRASNSKAFPTWEQLAEMLLGELYPDVTDPDDLDRLRRMASGTSGAMRLAQEYEVAFGNAALREFIVNTIPDQEHVPGKVHCRLVELNWADVFTTNYDTLLERAAEIVQRERPFRIVRSPSELPFSRSPRIVKLHGHLPELTNLVLTEDDYRNYPTTNAPFVSEIQVALIETHLCMVGFSGDDPNFLHWTGWVRDQLQTNIPYLYFFTFDALTDFRRRLLEDRRIIPLHLPSLFPKAKDRQAQLLALFEFLYSPPGPPRPAWNHFTSESMPSSRSGADRTESAGDWLQLADKWRSERRGYLGWLIPHRHAIEALWNSTEHWASKAPPDDLDVPSTVFVLWELTWRCRTALFPLFDDVVEKSVIPAIQKFDRWLTESVHFDASGAAKPAEFPLRAGTVTVTIVTADLVSAAIELQLETLRHSRETGDLSRFHNLAGAVQEIVAPVLTDSDDSLSVAETKHALGDISRARHFLSHEIALAHMANMRDSMACEVLNDWDTTGVPDWSLKKAGLLIEIGFHEQGQALWQEAYGHIQAQSRNHDSSVFEMSCAGWLAWLMRRAEPANNQLSRVDRAASRGKANRSTTDSIDPLISVSRSLAIQDSDRGQPAKKRPSRENEKPWNSVDDLSRQLDLLKKFDCHPQDLLEWISDANEREFGNSNEQEKIEFDPGKRTNSYTLSDKGLQERVVTGYRSLRLMEEVGIPRRFRDIGWTSFIHRPAIRILAKVDAREALGAFLRFRDADLFNDVLSRGAVARLAEESGRAPGLHRELLAKAVDSAFMLIAKAPAAVGTPGTPEHRDEQSLRHNLEFSLELISRLSVVQTDEVLVPLFTRLATLTEQLELGRRWWIAEDVSQLLTRILSSMSDVALASSLDPLLKIPLRGDGVLRDLPSHSRWIDPAKALRRLGANSPFAIARDHVKQLIEHVTHGSDHVREAASLRLLYLHEAGVLRPTEQMSWTRAIYERVDDQFKLPIATGCLDGLVLSLPRIRGVKEKSLFKEKYLENWSQLNGDWNDYWAVASTCSQEPQAKKRVIRWSRKEIQKLIEFAQSGFDEQLRILTVHGDSDERRPQTFGFVDPRPDIERTAHAICDMLVECVIRGPLSSNSERETVVEIIRNAYQAGLPTLIAFPSLVEVAPEIQTLLEDELIVGLGSQTAARFRMAVNALHRWLQNVNSNHDFPEPDRSVLLAIVPQLTSGNVVALSRALRACGKILEVHPVDGFVERVLPSFEDLIPHLSYAAERGRSSWGRPPKFSLADLPELRAALTVAVCGLSMHSELTARLKAWMEEVKHDPLPEVRRLATDYVIRE